MELNLSENIRAFRKNRHLTQEALSEILGVTPGAVYKWESGLSVPELSMIIEMADFFDVSVDTLLGYRMKDNRIASVNERLAAYIRTQDPRAVTEAEKALKKYPYSFEIVQQCAFVYMLNSYGGNREYLEKAKELFERSLLLVSQNTDPRIGELTVYGDLANVCILAGEHEKGIELLKQHNIGGIFNDRIGINLAVMLDRYDEAEEYLSNAFLSDIASLIDVIFGYVYIYSQRKDYDSAMDMIRWGENLIGGLKQDEQNDFMVKVTSFMEILKAHLLSLKGQMPEAEEAFRKASEAAECFDASPAYTLNTLPFMASRDNILVHDMLGSTAAESVENIIRILNNPKLEELWRKRSL